MRRCSPTTTPGALELSRAAGQADRGVRRTSARRARSTPATARSLSTRSRRRLGTTEKPRSRSWSRPAQRGRSPRPPRTSAHRCRRSCTARPPSRKRAIELLAAGDAERAAEMDALLAELWWYRGEPERSSEHLERAYALVKSSPPSPAKAHVISQVARYRMLAGAREEAIRIGGEALAMAEELGSRELQAHALVNIGTARTNMGDASGIEDLERAIEIASATGSPEHRTRSRTISERRTGCSATCAADWMLMEEAVGHGGAGRRGTIWSSSHGTSATGCSSEQAAGTIALPHIEEFLAACEAGEPHYHEGGMRLRRAAVRLARDDVEGALDDVGRPLPLARQAGDPQQRVPWLSGCARLLVEAGSVDDARATRRTRRSWRVSCPGRCGDLALVAEELGCTDELAELLERAQQTKWTDRVARLAATTTSSRPPRRSTRSAMPSSRRSRASVPQSSSSPRGAAPKPTSSCSARSRSGGPSARRATSARPRRCSPPRPSRRPRRAPSGRARP